ARQREVKVRSSSVQLSRRSKPDLHRFSITTVPELLQAPRVTSSNPRRLTGRLSVSTFSWRVCAARRSCVSMPGQASWISRETHGSLESTATCTLADWKAPRITCAPTHQRLLPQQHVWTL